MSAILLQQHLVITCYNLTKWPPVFNLLALRPVTSAMPTMQSTTRLPRNIKDSAGLENHQSSFILFEINHILDGWKCNGFQIIIRRLYIYIWETHLYLDEDAPKRMWGTGEPAFLKPKKGGFHVSCHRRVHLVSSRQLSGSQIASAAACSSLCWTPMRSFEGRPAMGRTMVTKQSVGICSFARASQRVISWDIGPLFQSPLIGGIPKFHRQILIEV